MAVFLIDFDGTCVPNLPESGFTEVDTGAERVLKRLVLSGHKLILWTCRNSSRNNPYNYIGGRFRTETSLEEAVRWFKERDIPLYSVNENPEEEGIIGYARKALGDFIIDDTSIGIPIVTGVCEYVSYDTGEIKTVTTTCVDWSSVERILEQMMLV